MTIRRITKGSVRREALLRVIVAPVYTIAQIVIIPAILAVGVMIGIVTIFNVLLFRKRSGAVFKRPVSRTSLFIDDALNWNFNNLNRAWNGPLSFFNLRPPI